MELNVWSAAMVYVLAFLGLLFVALLVTFVLIASMYNISFTVGKYGDQGAGSGDLQESTTWGVPLNSKDMPEQIERDS